MTDYGGNKKHLKKNSAKWDVENITKSIHELITGMKELRRIDLKLLEQFNFIDSEIRTLTKKRLESLMQRLGNRRKSEPECMMPYQWSPENLPPLVRRQSDGNLKQILNRRLSKTVEPDSPELLQSEFLQNYSLSEEEEEEGDDAFSGAQTDSWDTRL